MNIKDEIVNFIKDKNLSKEEALRYIYLYTCRKYSFDHRYYNAIKTENKDLLDYIVNLREDINNAKFPNITCISYCESVLYPLITEILGIPTEVYGTNLSHRFVVSKLDDKEILLDATEEDLTRVKLGMNTTGYEIESIGNKKVSEDYIRKMDIKLKYIKNEYLDEHLLKRYSPQKISNVFGLAKSILNKYKFTNYSDAKSTINFVFDLFVNHIMDLYVPHGTVFTAKYESTGLYYIEGNYYKLFNAGYYRLKKLTLSEAYYLIENYKSYDRDALVNFDVKELKR